MLSNQTIANSVQDKNTSLIKHLRDFGVGPIAGLFISLFTVPVVTRTISPDEFGKSSLFTLTHTIFLFTALLGIDQAFIRYFNVKDINKKRLLYNSLVPPFIVCAILIIGIFLFRTPLSFWLFNQYEVFIIVLLCIFLPLLIINRFAMLIIRMELRGKLYSMLNITAQLINFFCLLFFLLVYEKSFRSVIYGTIFAVFINTAIAVFFTRRSWLLPDFHIDKKLLRLLLQFGLPLLPSTVLFWIMSSFDKIGLKQWSSYEEIGLYAASFKVVSPLTVLQNIFTTAWIPVAYKWYEEKADRGNFEKVHKILLVFLCTGFSLVVVFRKILVMLLGPLYSDSASVMIYLLFSPVMYTLSSAMTIGIDISGKTKYNLYSALVCVCMNIIGNYMLIPHLGAKGAAISTAVSCIAHFFIRVCFSRKLWIKFSMKIVYLDILFLGILVLCAEFFLIKIFEIGIFVLILFFNFTMIKKHINIDTIKNIINNHE
jgi:O-antigen/teichoic acid export membrane protein